MLLIILLCKACEKKPLPLGIIVIENNNTHEMGSNEFTRMYFSITICMYDYALKLTHSIKSYKKLLHLYIPGGL